MAYNIAKEGASFVGKVNGAKPHANHAKASEKLPGLWAQMKAEGKNKTQAAPVIAERLGLAKTTVRRKLQGMN